MGENHVDPFATEERRALADLARRFTKTAITPHLSEWERVGRLPRDLHSAAAAAGLLGVGYPEDLGGGGGDLLDIVVLTEAILVAGGSGGLIASLFTHGIALPHVVDRVRRLQAGDSADRRQADRTIESIVRPVLEGTKILALAVTEPDGGSDVARLRTKAIADRQDGAWRVTGNKTYITSGVRADAFVVAARTGGPGAAGISLGLVDSADPGVTVVRELEKMGWRCSDTAELSFGGARFEPLGVDQGFASLARHFVVERVFLAVTAYATAQRCLDLTTDWVKRRETFGRPLAQRQVVRHTLVEMHRQIDVARTYARDVAVRHVAGESVALQAVLAKQTAVEACSFAVDRAVQLHGGAGFMADSEVEMHYRDARVLGIGGGATEVMTDLAATLMGI